MSKELTAIKHYEAALMALYPVHGNAWEHWNEARKTMIHGVSSDDTDEDEFAPILDPRSEFIRLTEEEIAELALIDRNSNRALTQNGFAKLIMDRLEEKNR